MKFPYGMSDFQQIILEDYYYCDRTGFIPMLEETGRSLLFIRPRRFGKSLLLSMLENYYDVAKKDQFDQIFGKLAVGKNPTKSRNNFFILKWDFSRVNPMVSVLDIQESLYDHINSTIRTFKRYYRSYLPEEIEINLKDATISLDSLISVIQMTDMRIYLLIDEYDNFANEIMVDAKEGHQIYENLIYKDGPFKTLFKAVKSLTGSFGIDRTFITGVSPIVMSDLTSGYNIAEDIYLEPEFNLLCGFADAEIEDAILTIAAQCKLSDSQARHVIEQMRLWYNDYTFSHNAEESVYNPTMVIYFFKKFQKNCQYPDNMLDSNLSMDQAKLEYIAAIPKGAQMIMDISNQGHILLDTNLVARFGLADMLSDTAKNNCFLASYLYYFGILSYGGRTEEGELQLNIPNLVICGLYVERIKQMLLPEPAMRDDGMTAAKKLYVNGDLNY